MFPAKRWNFWFRACVRCDGDAYLDLTDVPEWRCLQCGRVIPPERATDRSAAAGAAPRADQGRPRLSVFKRPSNGDDDSQRVSARGP